MSLILALVVTAAFTACTDGEEAGDSDPLLERGQGSSGSQLLPGLATRGPTEEGESSETDSTQATGTSLLPTSETDPTPTAASAAELDRAALVALYRATGGDNWTDDTGWLSDDPVDEWSGVTTDADGRVIALDLNDNNLIGTIRQGSRFLTALTQLDLGNNELGGCLPTNLKEQLDIADSDLGGLPFCVDERSALVALYRATGGDNWTDDTGWLSDDPVDEWSGVTADDRGRVTALALSDNNLAGTVPSDLHVLTQLTQLDLGGNRLDGCLPVNLQDELNMAESDLAGLPFCCGGHGNPPGSAPAPTRALNPPPSQTSAETDKDALLAIFDATDGANWDYSDTWASHAPIDEWEGVTTDKDGRVVGLDVNLGGAEIPPEVGHLTALTILTLAEVSGEIPPELGYLVNLKQLYLQENQLCGKIPTELGRLASLQEMYLHDNNLSGSIPTELSSLGSLHTLNLSRNQLSGKIPTELGRLASLQELGLNENELSGEIPRELGSLDSLRILYLENNHLTGDIPPEWENRAFTLEEIRFGWNQLGGCVSDLLRDYVHVSSGEIPVCAPEDHPGDTDALIALYNAWGKPDYLENWLSREPIAEWVGVSVDATGRVAALIVEGEVRGFSTYRRLSGEIPPELGSLTSLRYLNLRINGLTGELPAELGNLSNLQVLNLAENELTGEPPAELGNLSNLQVLNLAENGLTGELPAELGNLSNLQILNLAKNELTSGGKCLPGQSMTLSFSLSMLGPHGELCLTDGEFVSVSAGSTHACGVTSDSSLVCWGNLYFDNASPPSGMFTSVGAGYLKTCGAKADGSVACWGDHRDWRVAGEFVSVSVGIPNSWDGTPHACGVKANGSVACWGRNNRDQADPPTGEFASVSAGREHTCGVRTDGSVACWGEDRSGQATPPEGTFASVSAGNRYTCGVKTDGSVACWGYDEYGQATPPDGEFVSVSAGYTNSCGVRTDGSVACWGDNEYGQATPPDGEFVSVSAGVSVNGGGTIGHGAGLGYTCGVKTNGSIACWGVGFQ